MEEEVEALLMDLNQVPLQDMMSLGRGQLLLVEKSSPKCELISISAQGLAQFERGGTEVDNLILP